MRCGSSHQAKGKNVSTTHGRWPSRRGVGKRCEIGISTERPDTKEAGVGPGVIDTGVGSVLELLISQVEIEYWSAKTRGKNIKITIKGTLAILTVWMQYHVR